MATKQLLIVLLTLLLALRPGAQKLLTESESEANPVPVGTERDRSHQIQALEEQLARLRLEEQILASELSVPGTNRVNTNVPGSSFEVVSVTRSPLAETEKGDDGRKANEAVAAHDTAPRGTQPVSVAQADRELEADRGLEAGRPTTPNAEEQTINAGASFLEFLEEGREEEKGEDISMSEVLYLLLRRLLRRWRKSYAAAMAWQLFSYLNGLGVRTWSQIEKAIEHIADQCTEARETQSAKAWAQCTLRLAKPALKSYSESMWRGFCAQWNAVSGYPAEVFTQAEWDWRKLGPEIARIPRAVKDRAVLEYKLLKRFIDANRSEHNAYVGPEDAAMLLTAVWVCLGTAWALLYRYLLRKKDSAHRALIPDWDRIFPQVGIGIEFEQAVFPGPITVKRLEDGSAAKRSRRVRPGDVVHSIQGELCHNRTLKEMEDYVIGEPLGEVTLALLKPGAPHSVLTQPLPDISAWIKPHFPFRMVTLRRAWVEPAPRPASMPALLPALQEREIQRKSLAQQLAHRLSHLSAATTKKRSSTASSRSSSRQPKRHTVAEVRGGGYVGGVPAAGGSGERARRKSERGGKKREPEFRLPNGWSSRGDHVPAALESAHAPDESPSKGRQAAEEQSRADISTSSSPGASGSGSVAESPDAHADILKLRAALNKTSHTPSPLGGDYKSTPKSQAGSLARRLSLLFGSGAGGSREGSTSRAAAVPGTPASPAPQARPAADEAVVDVAAMERAARHSVVQSRRQQRLAEWLAEFDAQYRVAGALTAQTVQLKARGANRAPLLLNKQFCRCTHLYVLTYIVIHLQMCAFVSVC